MSNNINDTFRNVANVHKDVWNSNQLKWLRHEIKQLKASARKPYDFKNFVDPGNGSRPESVFPFEPVDRLQPLSRFVNVDPSNSIRQAVINKIQHFKSELKVAQPRFMFLQECHAPHGLYHHSSHDIMQVTKMFLMPINTDPSSDKTLVFSDTASNHPEMLERCSQPISPTENSNSFRYDLRHTVIQNNGHPYNRLDNLTVEKVYDHVPGTMLEVTPDKFLANTFFKSGKNKDYILVIFHLPDILTIF